MRCILLAPRQDKIPFRPAKAIDCDLILRVPDGIEIGAAGVETAAILIAVNRHQIAQRSPGVNCQQRVEGAAQGPESRHASHRRDPLVPDRFAAELSRMSWLAGFTSGTPVLTRDGAFQAS